MHQVAQICTYIFKHFFGGYLPPPIPKTGEGLSPFHRLFHIDECPPSHFFRASAAAVLYICECCCIILANRNCHGSASSNQTGSSDIWLINVFVIFITPPPIHRGRGIVFDRFLSFFVSFSARLRENGWTNLHEIFREGAEWPWDDLITFLVNSEKPRDAQHGGGGFVVL